MYVATSQQLIGFQDYFDVLSRLWIKSFSKHAYLFQNIAWSSFKPQ